MIRRLKNGYSISTRSWMFAPYILLRGPHGTVALRVYTERGMNREAVSRTHFSVHHTKSAKFSIQSAKLRYYGDDAGDALDAAQEKWGLEVVPDEDFPEFKEHFQ